MNLYFLISGIIASAAAAIVYNFLLSLLNAPYQFLLHAIIYGVVGYILLISNASEEILLIVVSFVILRIFFMKKRTHELFLNNKETANIIDE